MDEKVRYATGVTASKGPRLDLIPYAALVALAGRFELGLERHEDGAWNARDDKEFPADLEWVMARLSHIISHAYKAMGKITGKLPNDGEDDAGAIMWGGAFLACYYEHMNKLKTRGGCVDFGKHSIPDIIVPANPSEIPEDPSKLSTDELVVRHTQDSEIPAKPRPETQLFPMLSESARLKLRLTEWPIEATPKTICAEITELQGLKYIESIDISTHQSPDQHVWGLPDQGSAWLESNK